ncbi:MAG: molybdopterin molybdotransferase MoeA [Deltaproteobacteria bacterium]|nr:molybdopterin molybdotransferase MoeA [Deltaproteobacteria bacterium]
MKNVKFSQALAIALNAARTGAIETVELSDALHRVLARHVTSDTDMPPFPRAVMDGYACRRRDLNLSLRIVGEVAAGEMPAVKVKERECVRIMTGAPMPDGADCVVMVENTKQLDDHTIALLAPQSAANICPAGEDVKSGDVVLQKGTLLCAAHMAVLAAVGQAQVPVFRRPVVGIIATGNELVEPNMSIGGAQIRNSNSYQTLAQVLGAGALPKYFGIADDTIDATRKMIATAKAGCDVVIVSGGVSMGKYDRVPDALLAEGFAFKYTSVAMQPGKPTVFGVADDGTHCFGMPGNPVSSLVVFELIVKPFLYRLMGHDHTPRVVSATLSRACERPKTDRLSSIPVRFTSPDEVTPVAYHGSAHIHAFCHADGLVSLPEGVARLERGSVVHVRCL